MLRVIAIAIAIQHVSLLLLVPLLLLVILLVRTRLCFRVRIHIRMCIRIRSCIRVRLRLRVRDRLRVRVRVADSAASYLDNRLGSKLPRIKLKKLAKQTRHSTKYYLLSFVTITYDLFLLMITSYD